MLTLLKLRWIILRNRYKLLPRLDKIAAPIAILILIVLVFGVSILTINHFGLTDADSRTSYYFFLCCILLVTASNLVRRIHKEIFNSEVHILFTAPLRSRDIFLFKNVEITIVSFLFVALSYVPSQIYYGFVNSSPAIYYFITISVLFLLLSMITASAQIFVVLLLRFVDFGYQKGFVDFVSIIMGFLSFVFIMFGFNRDDFTYFMESVTKTENGLFLILLSPYKAIELSLVYDLAGALTFWGVFTVAGIGVVSLAIIFLDRCYYSGWFSFGDVRRKPLLKKGFIINVPKRYSTSITAIILKDIKILFRDTKILELLVVPLMFFSLYVFWSYQDQSNEIVAVLFVLFFWWSSFRFPIYFVLSEGYNINIIKTSPLRVEDILLSKIAVSVLFCMTFIGLIGFATFYIFLILHLFLLFYIACIPIVFFICFISVIYSYQHLEFDSEKNLLSVNYKGVIKIIAYNIGLFLFVFLFFMFSYVLFDSSRMTSYFDFFVGNISVLAFYLLILFSGVYFVVFKMRKLSKKLIHV